MGADMENPVVVLDAAESWDLLAASELGRLAVSVGDQPEIFPINYLAHEGVVIFRTTQGHKLVSLTINRHVALETDGYTAAAAWGDIVKGTARALEREIDIDVATTLPLHSWIPTINTFLSRSLRNRSPAAGSPVVQNPGGEDSYLRTRSRAWSWVDDINPANPWLWHSCLAGGTFPVPRSASISPCFGQAIRFALPRCHLRSAGKAAVSPASARSPGVVKDPPWTLSVRADE